MHGSGVGYVILGALRHEPRSGYEIKQLVDKATRFFWAASYGQIYPELRRLEKEGLIESSNELADARRRVRYRLTRTGHAELKRWLREPATGYELRDEGLLKLFFADAIGAKDARALVRNLRVERESTLKRLRQIDQGRVGGFPGVVLAYGIEHHEWIVDWCARLERRLEETGREVAR